MSFFWRLKKINYYFAAIKLHKILSKLNKYSVEEIEDELRSSNLEIYEEERIQNNILIRLTMPFALLTMLVLILLSPINYILSGHWGYKWLPLRNWFRALGF